MVFGDSSCENKNLNKKKSSYINLQHCNQNLSSDQSKLSWIIPLNKQLELWNTNVFILSMWHTMDAISKTTWVAFAMSTNEGAKHGEDEHIHENAH